MRLEFSDCYELLFNDALIKLKRTWLTRLRAMKECRAQLRDFNRTEKIKAQLAGLKKPKHMSSKENNEINKFDQIKQTTMAFRKSKHFSFRALSLEDIDDKSF